MSPYTLLGIVVLGAVAVAARILARRHRERPGGPEHQEPPPAPGPVPVRRSARWEGPDNEGDVHEVEVASQDREQGYRRLFYILGKRGAAALRLHVWCNWECRSELRGFQIVTGIDKGIVINWRGERATDLFSSMEWEDDTSFRPVRFSGKAGSAAELRRCIDILRASRLERTVAEPIIQVLERKTRETGPC